MPSKKLFLASTVLFVLASLPFVGSVGASLEMWSRTYGGEYGNIVYSFDRASSVVETSDGGFALVGTRHYFGSILDSWLVKTDEYGIIPEFPSWAILPLLLMATLVAIICKRRLFSAD